MGRGFDSIFEPLFKIFFMESKGKKSTVEEILDSLLKVTYPFISQYMKWTDMRSDLSMSDGKIKIILMPKYLPHGYEQKTELNVGYKFVKSIPDLTKVDVWRSNEIVFYEHKGVWFYKPIISMASLVDMEDAKSGHVAYTLSATGKAKGLCRHLLGDITITEKQSCGRPVYKNICGSKMYGVLNGQWHASNGHQIIQSKSAAPSPDLCKEWVFWDQYAYSSIVQDQTIDVGDWRDGDIKVEVNYRA